MDYAGSKDRKPVVMGLKAVYRAVDADSAAAWRRKWAEVIPFLSHLQDVRRVIYATNAIESLNSMIRRSVRARSHFPSEEAAIKLIWLQPRVVTKDWKMPARQWYAAKAQFGLLFGDRFELHQ